MKKIKVLNSTLDSIPIILHTLIEKTRNSCIIYDLSYRNPNERQPISSANKGISGFKG